MLELRMRVNARCRYRDFKSHVTTARGTRWKRVAVQDRYVVGEFVVAAVHDFVDTSKDCLFARVKLLNQKTGSSSHTMLLTPQGNR